MKNKKVWLIIGVILVLVIGAVFVFGQSRGEQDTDKSGGTLPKSAKLVPVESSVKVSVEKSDDGKKAILTIENIPSKYEDIDYEFTYDTSENVPRGVLGVLQVEDGRVEKEIVLGSCSTNICTYDEGVNKVLVNLKFNSPSGSRGFEKKYLLE